jgi:hypothetical protein
MGNGVAEAPARVEDRAPIGPAEGLEAGTVAESDPAVGNLRAICEGEGVELFLLGLVEDGGQAAPLGLTGSLSLDEYSILKINLLIEYTKYEYVYLVKEKLFQNRIKLTN